MAADPSAAGRAYDAVKRQLLAGDFHLGQRLDAVVIASALGTSTTPVREALVRLHSERLIALKPARGFFCSLWTRAELEDLYRWRAALAVLALLDPDEAKLRAALSAAPSDYAGRSAGVLKAAIPAGARELMRASENADERLHAARLAEADLWPETMADWAALEAALLQGGKAMRVRAVRAFHEKRVAGAPRIRERALLRAAGNGG